MVTKFLTHYNTHKVRRGYKRALAGRVPTSNDRFYMHGWQVGYAQLFSEHLSQAVAKITLEKVGA